MPVRYERAAAAALRFIIESVNPGCASRSQSEAKLRRVSVPVQPFRPIMAFSILAGLAGPG
jgi:hypothetical protein